MEPPEQEVFDDEAWAEEQGIPSFSEPFLQKYLDGRDALIAQEKQQRSDHAFKETLSPMVAQASAIVAGIRFEEQQTLWNPTYEDNLAAQSDAKIYPGMMFSLAKKRMESSKLWKIVKKMPKGTLLHCHLDALGDLDDTLDHAIKTPGMCISAEQPLTTPEALQSVNFKFQFVKGLIKSDSASIWSEKYTSNDWIPLPQAVESFPNGGKSAFISWFRSRVTITPEISLQHHVGPNDIWTRFLACFPILASLNHYEPIFRHFIRTLLSQLHEDGVRWVDMRTQFRAPFWRTDAAEPDEGNDGLLAALQDEIDLFTNSEEGKGFWGARLIWTSVRAWDKRRIVEDMKDCIAMKLQFPDLICGYDLVGREDIGQSLAELTPELFWFRKKCMEEGVDIPFVFHAGETLGDGDEVDENLFDAILLGTRRIGHGFSLYKHPLLIDMVKEKKILIESCPVSNEVLRLTGSICSHPLPALLARGVHCSLSNDDPAILGQVATGMTHDFWQALQGWENLGLDGLASLAENSVRWALYEDCNSKQWAQEMKDGAYGKGIRAKRLREWSQEFEKFCQWVVLEYGADHEIDTLD